MRLILTLKRWKNNGTLFEVWITLFWGK